MSEQSDKFKHYLTGISVLDAEHWALITAMRSLETDDSSTVDELVSKASDIVKQFHAHLTHEEDMMESIGYPYAASHHAQHRELLVMLRKYESQLANPHRSPLNRSIHLLSEFLYVHIDQSDIQFADYIKTHCGTSDDPS